MKRQCKHLASFLGLGFFWLGLSIQRECIWVSTEEALLDITQTPAKATQPQNLLMEIQVLLFVDQKLNKSFEVSASKSFKNAVPTYSFGIYVCLLKSCLE